MSDITLLSLEQNGQKQKLIVSKEIVCKSEKWKTCFESDWKENQTNTIETNLDIHNLNGIIKVLSSQNVSKELENYNLRTLITLRELSVEYIIESLTKEIDDILPKKIKEELPHLKICQNLDEVFITRRQGEVDYETLGDCFYLDKVEAVDCLIEYAFDGNFEKPPYSEKVITDFLKKEMIEGSIWNDPDKFKNIYDENFKDKDVPDIDDYQDKIEYILNSNMLSFDEKKEIFYDYVFVNEINHIYVIDSLGKKQ